MRIIDEKGKVFGWIHIIDLVLIMFLILVGIILIKILLPPQVKESEVSTIEKEFIISATRASTQIDAIIPPGTLNNKLTLLEKRYELDTEGKWKESWLIKVKADIIDDSIMIDGQKNTIPGSILLTTDNNQEIILNNAQFVDSNAIDLQIPIKITIISSQVFTFHLIKEGLSLQAPDNSTIVKILRVESTNDYNKKQITLILTPIDKKGHEYYLDQWLVPGKTVSIPMEQLIIEGMIANVSN